MSTNALLVVGDGANESGEVRAGTVPSTAGGGGVVVVVGGASVVTVVRGGTVEGVTGLDVDVDRVVGGLVTTVSIGVPDDADVGADVSPSALHPATPAASSATSTTLDRQIIRSIMSSWAIMLPAKRENDPRLAFANRPHRL